MANETTDVDLTGRKIREYELLRRIGVGGMGVVYEGRHPVIGKKVAVKFLLTSLSADKDLVERFKAEARSVNEIGHRGIVDIFDFGQLEDGTQYFVMELLDGRGFDQVIRAEAPLHPALAVRYLEEIVDALAAAHSAGVIHRDIKPSNVFLVESQKSRPYIKLLDFGIAKVNATKTGSTPQTRQSVVIGTPEYIAPEQAQGKPVSAATDLYAVGCMAYEMLTGKLPFRGENPLDTMFKHVTEATPRVSASVPGTPKVLDELVFQLMQKRAEDRPNSAEEVMKRLEASRGLLTTEGLPSMSPPTRPMPVGENTESAALASTFQSMSSVKVPVVAAAVAGASAQPSTAASLAAMKPSRLPMTLALGVVAAGALGVAAFVLTRPAPEPILVEPPPPAEVKPAEVKPAEVKPAEVKPAEPAEVKVAPPVAKKGPTTAQLNTRVAAVARKLEQRESSRGEVNSVFRGLLQQMKEAANAAKTDADRRQALSDLDDLARQIER